MSEVVVCYGKDIIKRTITALEILNPSLPNKNTKIILKPNIVEPIAKNSGGVTRPEVIEGIIRFFGDQFYEIYLVEGAAVRDTMKCFKEAGYLYLEKSYALKIRDLHTLSFVKVEGKFWKEFEIAELFKGSYIISVPVLKQHPFNVTLSLKNMMGILKPRQSYPTKAYMHKEPDRTIWAERLLDLITHARPHLAVIDATTGMFNSHLHGRLKTFNATIVCEDALACDIAGAHFLGCKNVFYLDMALKRGMGELPTVIEKTLP
jgi:uncharacterized protein (DUF362 family)